MTENSASKIAADLISKLRSERLTFFPIRHHSPACAAQIERWILKERPAVILVEGPSSFNSRIEQLTDERCVCPVALYTSFVDKKGRIHKILNEANRKNSKAQSDSGTEYGPGSKAESEQKDEQERKVEPPRFAAYYPFCDYSPELVALRTGRQIGAKCRFIDLEYGEMVLAQFSSKIDSTENTNGGDDDDAVRIVSLQQDAHLAESSFMGALAQALGCRDFNELWDHLFENLQDETSPEEFMDRLAVYCALARLEYRDDELRADATFAREACMVRRIVEELNNCDGKILVVTGGFHTAALPALVERSMSEQTTARKSSAKNQAAVAKAMKESLAPEQVELDRDELAVWLMRYSFDKLDALAGYSAGMPAPAFYDNLWRMRQPLDANPAAHSELSERMEHAAAEFIVQIGRLTRERKFNNLIATPDAIAAWQMAKQLASMRSHKWPLREDILDGVRSCFIKGELNVEGLLVQQLVREVLAGNRVGDIPPGGDLPPIVDDFYLSGKKFRLSFEQVERKEITLDLYRNATHREMSRFFYRLTFLEIPFARFVSGPDFVRGMQLDLMQEIWNTMWSPMVESSLVEASIFGSSLEEASANKLKNMILKLEDNAQARSAVHAVELLVRACRLGLHRQASSLVPLIDSHIAEDPQLRSVVAGLSQLELLQNAREPLEAFQLKAIPRLMEAAFQRACRLLDDIAYCPDAEIDSALSALQILREILVSARETTRETARETTQETTQETKRETARESETSPRLDDELFYLGLNRILNSDPEKAKPAIIGATAGILYGDGRIDNAELIQLICGYLGGAISDPRKSVGVIRGLLASSCEIAWQVAEVLEALDNQFQSWTDETFVEMLPELRLAFTSLAPRDISRVADLVSNLHKGQKLGELVHYDLDEQEIQYGLSLNESVRKALLADGLSND